MSETELIAARASCAFLVAGGYVATMARVAERVGSKVGGLLLALPSTVLVGISFIALSEGHDALRDGSAVLPATIAAATIFLTAFIRSMRFGLVVAYALAILAWLTVTVPIARFDMGFPLAFVLGVAIFAITTTAFRHAPHRNAKAVSRTWRVTATRFVVAGTIAAATVIVARVAGPTWGAVCASFPAVFCGSLFFMARAHGIEFTTSLGRTMIVGCMANAVFGIFVHVMSAFANSLVSIASAYALTLLFALWAYRFLIERLGSASSKT